MLSPATHWHVNIETRQKKTGIIETEIGEAGALAFSPAKASFKFCKVCEPTRGLCCTRQAQKPSARQALQFHLIIAETALSSARKRRGWAGNARSRKFAGNCKGDGIVRRACGNESMEAEGGRAGGSVAHAMRRTADMAMM
jgi:hypothetical protein